MSNPTQAASTINNIGVAMFTIADQDAAIAFYTQILGWELRADVAFGDEGSNRWVEVAPPGSTARLARSTLRRATRGPAAARSASRRPTSRQSTRASRQSTASRPAR